MVRDVVKTIAAIFAAGAILHAVRGVPVLGDAAKIVTKGYGE